MKRERPAKRTVARDVIGWREWVELTDWAVPAVKAKIDTGARTSALHAFDITSFERKGEPWVRFSIHPWQRSSADGTEIEVRQVDERAVTSSSGLTTVRPVVMTTIRLGERVLPIELTLTSRDEMGFRMLLGRQALRENFLVDPAKSYLGGRPPRAMRMKNRGRHAAK